MKQVLVVKITFVTLHFITFTILNFDISPIKTM